MKQIAIRKQFGYFYVDSTEIESGEFDDKLEALDREMKNILEKFGLQFAEVHTSFYGLEKYSISSCDKCNHLMINRNKNPSGFAGNELAQEIEFVIYNGGEYEGQLLCEECLPVTHRWGCHS